jgi:hypothetical protein
MTSTGSERTRKILIDEYSLATVPIEMFFDQTPPLSTGTAFIWTEGGNFFLITNWHNLFHWKARFTNRCRAQSHRRLAFIERVRLASKTPSGRV